MRHVVFLSYPRDIPIVRKFTDELHDVLSSQLMLFDKRFSIVYDDRMESKRTGTDWREWVTPLLVDSAVMVAVCSPAYFKSRGCLEEFHGMKQLVERRRKLTGESPPYYMFALQLVDQPHPLLGGVRVSQAFVDYTLQPGRLDRKAKYLKEIAQIRDQILQSWNHLSGDALKAQLEADAAANPFKLPEVDLPAAPPVPAYPLDGMRG